MFYHVSKDPTGQYITCQDHPYAGNEGVWYPEVPKRSHNEITIPRVCIAPTVGQCLISRPGTKAREKYHIYQVQVINPDTESPQHPESGVVDAWMTLEAWITESVIRENGGVIELTRIGSLSLCPGEIITLKRYAVGGDFEMYQGQEDVFWRIDGEDWILKEESRRPRPSAARTPPCGDDKEMLKIYETMWDDE
jgi:hypothetical protein